MDSAIFEIFKQYTKRYVKLTDEELDRIESVCTYKKLRKQQFLTDRCITSCSDRLL